MTVAEVVVHVADGNDDGCSAISGQKAPTRTAISPTAGKAQLVARLKETFAYCDTVLATVDDSKLTGSVYSGADAETQVQAMMDLCGHWADHYSQFAMYLRLNGILPPTAVDPTM